MTAFRHFRTAVLTTVVFFALSGCSWVAEGPSATAYNTWDNSAANTPAPPETRVMQTADSTWLEPDRNAKPVPNASEIAELNQANKRIGELETEIAAIRNDMNMMMPALTKLAGGSPSVAALNNIQPAAGASAGAGEVGRIHRNYMQSEAGYGDDPEAAADTPLAMAPMVESVPAPPPPAAATMKTPPVAVQAPVRMMPAAYTPPTLNVTSIKGVRFGSHEGGKSRMVIDVSAASSFTFNVDNNERILMVEIPGTVWNAGPVTRMIQGNPLLTSMAASPDGQGGTRVVFQLASPAKVQWSQTIPPSGGQGNRIVLDVVPAL